MCGGRVIVLIAHKQNGLSNWEGFGVLCIADTPFGAGHMPRFGALAAAKNLVSCLVKDWRGTEE
jgi:hypothetical protein